jgi:biotin carboxyl carrier protein
MKVNIVIDGRTYAVEVGDLSVRPIIALVDGEPFEVWPEEGMSARPAPSPGGPQAASGARPAASPVPASGQTGAAAEGGNTRKPSGAVHAPIPGVIVSVAVEPGMTVAHGQELCVLEAMKMKNAVRAARAGTVRTVHVHVGQQVKQRDLLVEYED